MGEFRLPEDVLEENSADFPAIEASLRPASALRKALRLGAERLFSGV